MSTTTADAGRSPLTRLYLTRGVLAVAWAVAFAGAYKVARVPERGGGHAAGRLPAARRGVVRGRLPLGPDGPERRVTAFNGVLSTLAAIGVGIAGGASGAAAALATFGAWAVLSGAAQVSSGCGAAVPSSASSGRC